MSSWLNLFAITARLYFNSDVGQAREDRRRIQADRPPPRPRLPLPRPPRPLRLPLASGRQGHSAPGRPLYQCVYAAAARAGFEAAAEGLRGKHHDHLVSLIDFKKTQNNFYLFLELCEGGSLADYIRARRRLPEPEALRIFKQVLLGVSALHRSRLPHRDLKPDNILFQDGRVKLAHLGLSRRLDNKELLTAAPEALRRQPLSQKVDVFSAGTILYEMLYGCLPFKARDEQALLEAIDRGVHCAGEDVSQGTQELLREMLTPKPEDRIELLDVLDIVAGFEAEEQARRLEEYRASSLSQLQFLCVPGGLSCGL